VIEEVTGMKTLGQALREFAQDVKGFLEEAEKLGVITTPHFENDAEILYWFSTSPLIHKLSREKKKVKDPRIKEFVEAYINMTMNLDALLATYGVEMPLSMEEWEELLESDKAPSA